MTSLASKVISSSFLLLIVRLFQRSVGLISTLILARLLTPEDFGIVAISALIIHFCDILSETGAQQYIVQKTTLNEGDLNTAWTLNALLKGVLWVFLLVSIPYISEFYGRPEIKNVLYVSSLVLIVGALRSPGLFLLRRGLKYAPILKLSIIQKLASFAVAMLIVFLSPSYWALIVGELVSAITLTIGSYFVHAVRPRLCLRKVRQQWSFSQWLLFKGGVGFARAEADTMLVSKHFLPGDLGIYHLAKSLSVMPITDIIAPAIEPLIASFAKVKDDSQRLAYQATVSLLVICLLISPIVVFMCYFPALIIDFFLGKQWIKAYPLLSAFSILIYSMAIYQVLGQYCIALGKVKAIFVYDVLSFMFIVPTLVAYLYLSSQGNLNEFTALRSWLGVVTTMALFAYIISISKIQLLHTLKVMCPVLIAALAAANIITEIQFFETSFSIIKLLLTLVSYSAVYAIIIVLLYITYYRRTKEGRHLFQLTIKLYCKLSP